MSPTQHWFSPTPLSLETQQRFLNLEQGSKVQAEYVWIGGNNELRCKTKVCSALPSTRARFHMCVED